MLVIISTITLGFFMTRCYIITLLVIFNYCVIINNYLFYCYFWQLLLSIAKLRVCLARSYC